MKHTILYSTIILQLLSSCVDNKTAIENFNSGLDYYNNKNFTAALKEFSKAIEKDNKNVNSFFYKGLAEIGLEKKQDALISFQKTIELDSSFYQALVERAKLKIILGDYISAVIDCDKAKMIKIDFSDLYKTKAIAFENLNDASNAIISYEYAINYGQNDGETYYKLGILKLSYGIHEEACSLLSKAGELGYMDAFKTIKSNCNHSANLSKEKNTDFPKNDNQKTFGKFKVYPKRYSITFPSDWDVDEISNSDKSILTVSASKEGHFMSILEIDPALINLDFKAKPIYEYDKEEFLQEYRQKYSDFQLLKYEKKNVNGIDAYYFKMSFSFFSNQLQKQLSGITLMYVFFNSKTKHFYYLQGNADKNDIQTYEPVYLKTFNTFKFE